MAQVSFPGSFCAGASNFNTWLLFVQYACCFGVELAMNNVTASYFKSTLELSPKATATITSIFRWMNLFARGVGGFVLDKANARMGIRRHLWWQTGCLFIRVIMVLIFANTKSLRLVIFIMVIFSLLVQSDEGSSYASYSPTFKFPLSTLRCL